MRGGHRKPCSDSAILFCAYGWTWQIFREFSPKIRVRDTRAISRSHEALWWYAAAGVNRLDCDKLRKKSEGDTKMRFVRRLLWALVWVVMGCGFASAQHRTAPNGYYPPGYNGDAWVGRVMKVDSRTQSLTLVSVDKNRKRQTFVGVLENDYLVRHKSGRIEPLKVSEIPLGLKVTVFYEQRTKKVNGKKVHYNVIITMDRIRNRKKGYTIFQVYGNPATP